MKKTILFALLLLFASSAFALEFRPSTVQSMEVIITSEATGGFSGTITRGDELEIFFLTIEENENQELVSLEEYMQIGEKKISPEHIERNGLKYAKYKIDDLYNYAETNEFKVVRKATIKREISLGLGDDFNLENEITEFAEFTKATSFIEVNDQELRSKATLEFDSNSHLETVRQIVEWVNNNITYDFKNYYDGVYSAKETYNSRAGVCDEFANLTAAFTRIKGIPTKYVTGISFDGQRFGLHGWLEVFLPKTGWIGVDSTYGEAGYLDAAHFTIAKTSDANKAIDLIAITRSREKISMTTQLGLPQVEVVDVEFFDGILEAKIIKPKQVFLGELFEIKAEIENVSGKKAIFPIEMVFHEKFKASNTQKLVMFEPGETRTLTWEARAPEEKFEGGYYTYGIVLLIPDGNISDMIRVIPSKEYTKNGADIRVKDVSPFITGTNLEIKIGLENLGNAEGKAEIEIYFESNLVEEKEVVLKEFEERNFAYHVQNIRPGKVLVKIKTEDEKTFEITIPEKQEEVIVVEEVQQEQPLIENGFEGIDLSVEDLTLPALMGGAILVILIAIVALILAK